MSNIEALCADWLDAKREEAAAQKRRAAIEAQLAEALDVPQEGSKTHILENYKVRLTQPVYRKVDQELWDVVKGRVPAKLRPVKVKVEADATGCKYLSTNEPEAWAAIAEAFTTTPGKVGVKVEEVI